MNILQSAIMTPLPHEVELINQITKIIVRLNNSYLIALSPERCVVAISHVHLSGAPMHPAQQIKPGGCHNDMLEPSLLQIIYLCLLSINKYSSISPV